MTKHGKNATANSVYSYHERQKDKREGKYGLLKQRAGKDYQKDFDSCSLSLEPCKQPVITQDGYLFDKEAILEYMVHHKREIARKMKLYDEWKKKKSKEENKVQVDVKKKELAQFLKNERSSTSVNSIIQGKGTETEKTKANKSFWTPSLTPQAEDIVVEKPSKDVLCPMSGKVLKMKNLIDVKFKPASDVDEKSSLYSKNRYVCAVSGDVLNKSMALAVLKPSGYVVTMDVVNRVVRKDMIDPTCGQKLTESDIIRMERGTGFAGSGANLEAKLQTPTIPSA